MRARPARGKDVDEGADADHEAECDHPVQDAPVHKL
jgi:hypothetical protein